MGQVSIIFELLFPEERKRGAGAPAFPRAAQDAPAGRKPSKNFKKVLDGGETDG